MPEIKNNFLQGKMNKDLDERLVPNGQYRDAMNVEVSTSEESNVGTVQNILGNRRLDNLVGSGSVCVGSIADEKNNKLYWFISSYEKDAILEYDLDNDIVSPVVVDIYAGTQKSALKFFGNLITGINIIGDLLFWTDNKGEPKKINIKTCKAGTTDMNSHTQLIFETGSFTGYTVETVTTTSGNGTRNSIEGRYFNFHAKQFLKTINTWWHNPGNGGNDTVMSSFVRQYRDGDFIKNERLDFFNTVNEPNPNPQVGAPQNPQLSTDPPIFVEDSTITGVIPLETGGYPNTGTQARYSWGESSEQDWRPGDIIFGDNITIDLQERHITVIKPKPLKAPSIKINYEQVETSTAKKPNLFETDFPRFSYRYKYRDGEFSSLAPFTDVVFNPLYAKQTTDTDGGVYQNKDNAYDIKEHFNKAMENSIHSVELTNFINQDTPEDVVEVDILYKPEGSTVVYSISTIKHGEKEFHYQGSSEDYEIFENKALGSGWAATGGLQMGRYLITTENIYAALPANQLLRPWDNVPKKALAQEVTGNRIVYGNYLQNYTIENKPDISTFFDSRKQTLGTFESQGLPSIKSQRNYELGIVYLDAYGRETPVFTSANGAVIVPWQDKEGVKNASKSNQLIAKSLNNYPEWVESIKFFVKESSNEYYNLLMERAWVTKDTYELDNSEGHLWLCFPSSDRNKITEEDYIILKKKIGANESQVTFENKYKVIDIKNEAPDAIKYELINLGVKSNDSSNNFTVATAQGVTPAYDALFYKKAQRIDRVGNTDVVIDKSRWYNQDDGPDSALLPQLSSGDGEQREGIDIYKDLYISWFKINSDGTTTASTKYQVIGGWEGSSGYVMKLKHPIKEYDANIAHVNGVAIDESNSDNLHPDLHFQIERKVLKENEDFSGKFFVKISKNQTTNQIESNNEFDVLKKYRVTSGFGVFYWENNTGGSIDPSNANYGLSNYNGFIANHSSSNNILNAGGNNDTDSEYSGAGDLLDYHEMWENILDEYSNITASNGGGRDPKPRFFIDSTFMSSGQSNYSDYAKYNCVIWSGATKNDDTSVESSSWNYPPIKQWYTSEKGEDAKKVLNDLFETGMDYDDPALNPAQFSQSRQFDENDDFHGLKIDGWVGPSQFVQRNTPPTSYRYKNHINGLEGLVTTAEDHATGPRRWFSGMNGTEFGVGSETKTYSDNEEIGRHFMHLSFFAPGKDLHNNQWTLANVDGEPCLYGKDSWMDNLQGIWGGGVFTGPSLSDKFGPSFSQGNFLTNQHMHFPWEGNYDTGDSSDFKVLPEPPGPGVGFGYNTDFREEHERQWDPTFTHDKDGNLIGDPDNKIRDFIRNLYPGQKFRFNQTVPGGAGTTALLDDTTYTIKKVHIKKLYNHTSWRAPFNRWLSTGSYTVPTHTATTGYDSIYRSVEEEAMRFLHAQVDNDGKSSQTLNNNAATQYNQTHVETLKKKIVDFGAAHNRRLCFVIELDKNPVNSNSAMGNPLDANTNGEDNMSADIDNDNFTDIEFLTPIQDIVLSDLSKFKAIWETDPRKKQVDLDIYFEASSNIPVRINEKTNELFAPVGCKVEIINIDDPGNLNDVNILEWSDNIAIFEPGFPRYDANGLEIDYTEVKFKFIRKDGSYTIAETGQQVFVGSSASTQKRDFIFKTDIAKNIEVGLSWNNCFSFGNGLESNRIRDDFNQTFISNGVKASTTTQETYEEERRTNGLIYSGIYNSNAGINDLNQFIMAEKITKDLNPTYGSIQKLFSRDTDLVTFCEDKVVKILANKDAVFNADGNPQLTANENVLGQSIPFVGDYGISKNPESFASESYRAYFSDKQRGAVLRLSRDGLTPISKVGMHDWFRDNMSKYTSIIGTYDTYKEQYNITLANTYTENIVFNTYLQLGVGLVEETISLLNFVQNPLVNAGSSYELAYNPPGPVSGTANLTNASFGTAVPRHFTSDVTVTNHAAIPVGYYQQEVQASGQPPAPVIATAYVAGGSAAVPWAEATYETSNSGNLPDSGIFYNPVFNAASQLWIDGAPSGINPAGLGVINNDYDPNCFSNLRRYIDAHMISESNSFGHGWYTGPLVGEIYYLSTSNDPQITFDTGYDPHVEKPLEDPDGNIYARGGTDNAHATQCITRNSSTGNILFDRTGPGSAFKIRFDNVGAHPSPWNSVIGTSLDGSLNDAYTSSPGALYPSANHNTFFNGDELHIQIKLKVYPDMLGITFASGFGGSSGITYANSLGGYNVIRPTIRLRDNGVAINSDKFVQFGAIPTTPSSTYEDLWSNAYNTNGLIENVAPGSAMFTGYDDNPYGGITNCDYIQIKEAQNSSTVQFADTYFAELPNILTKNPIGKTRVIPGHGTAYYSNGMANFKIEPVEIVIGASWKFRDPNQQNADGSYSGSGFGIEEKAVVDKLQIEFYNDFDAYNDPKANAHMLTDPRGLFINAFNSQQQAYSAMSNLYGGAGIGENYNMPAGATGAFFESAIGNNKVRKHPVFEVIEVRAIKGFGITSTHTDPQAAVQGTTYYDDPTTTGVTEQLTVNDILNNGGALNANGDYVLNQAAIDNYNQNYTGSVYYIPPIPATAVPAFVEVTHATNVTTNSSYNINNGGTSSPNGAGMLAGDGGSALALTEEAYFGANRSAVLVTEQKTDPLTGNLDPNQTVTYYTPGPDPVDVFDSTTQTPQTYPFNKSWVDVSTGNSVTFAPGAGSAGTQFGLGSSPASQTYDNAVNPYFRHKANSATDGGSIGIAASISSDPWVPNTWYMCDVEFDYDTAAYPDDTNPPPVGSNQVPGDGMLAIRGAMDNNFANGFNLVTTPIDVALPDGEHYQSLHPPGIGYGLSGGGSVDRHAMLAPRFRTEYGDARWVLRCIWKTSAANDSRIFTASGEDEKFRLRFYGFRNEEIKVQKIILKNIDYVNGTGTSTNWSRGLPTITNAVNAHTMQHTLQRPIMYYYSAAGQNGKLCWENAINWFGGLGLWVQPFVDTQGNSISPLQDNGSDGYIFSFRVTKNPYTDSFGDPITGINGSLNARLSNSIDDFAVGEFAGIIIEGIADEGDYEVRFTMDNVDNGWEILKDSVLYTAATISPYDGSTQSNTYADAQNQIAFYCENAGGTAFTGAVNDISIVPSLLVYSGGTAGSWNFDGFNPSLDNYVTWVGGSTDGRIQFTNAFLYDPANSNILNSPGTNVVTINANQYIDTDIKRYETYEITFNYRMQDEDNNDGGGGLHCYYFNDEGYGFRIDNIFDPLTNPSPPAPNFQREEIFDPVTNDFLWYKATKVVEIGEAINDEFNINGGTQGLVNTLVFRRDGDINEPVTGWVDNISLRRVYNIELIDPDGVPESGDEYAAYPETTVSFSETVNGWTSFKSFIPESGLSLAKNYFTFKEGALYKHYSPMRFTYAQDIPGNTILSYAPLNISNQAFEPNNYNVFYYENLGLGNAFRASSITAVLNNEPSIVKTFHTLNYEGSQTFVKNPGSPDLVTINNAKAFELKDSSTTPTTYYDLQGWKCTDITSDLDSGNLNDFIKKEGKWFGYIKGKYKNNVNQYGSMVDIDTSKQNIQGIGFANSAIETTQ